MIVFLKTLQKLINLKIIKDHVKTKKETRNEKHNSATKGENAY